MADNDFRVKRGIVVGTDAYISNSITSVNTISFNTTQEFNPGVGSLAWDNAQGSVSLGLSNTVDLQLGLKNLFYVKNQSGSTISSNTVVMANGTVGNSGTILISPAIGNGNFPARYIMGVTAESIDNGEDGYVLSFGKLREINTSMFSEGDILYLDPANPGKMINTEPVAPSVKAVVAIVVTKHPTVGEIFVRPTFADRMNELQDVAILDGISNDHVLAWNSANSRFENKTISSNSFTTISVSGQSNVVADSSSDTIIFAAGAGIQLSTDPSTDTITITNTGGISGAGLIAGDYVVRAAKSGTDQTITGGSDTVVTFTDDFDPQNWFGSNKFQPTVAGYYSIATQIWWVAGSVTNNQNNIQFRKNGNIQIGIAQDQIVTGSGYTQVLSTIAYFNGSSDYVEVTAYTGNPTSQDIVGSSSGTYFTAALYAYGDAANTWVNANDYSTLLSARSNDYNTLLTAYSNDYATLLSARSNDYNTLFSAYSNDYATILSAQSNDGATLLTARSNDYNTLLSAYSNDGATLLSASANDYTTLLAAYSNDLSTLNTARANDYNTLLTAQANDYNSLTTLTANIYNTLLASYSNDLVTLNTARANDYATLLAAQSNDYATLLSAQANDFNSYTSLSANDYNSYTTLTANIYNTFAYLNANVGGGGGDVANSWVNANDYSTFTTLTANIYNTYETLTNAPLYAQKFTIDGSTNSFTLSNSVSSEESILVYLDGIVQHNDAYVVSGTNLTIANTLPLPTSTLGIRRLSGTTTSGSSTGGLSYLRTYALG